jgi:hypothetical protein
MTYQAALQKIEQAAAEQWEELDLSGMGKTINYLTIRVLCSEIHMTLKAFKLLDRKRFELYSSNVLLVIPSRRNLNRGIFSSVNLCNVFLRGPTWQVFRNF